MRMQKEGPSGSFFSCPGAFRREGCGRIVVVAFRRERRALSPVLPPNSKAKALRSLSTATANAERTRWIRHRKLGFWCDATWVLHLQRRALVCSGGILSIIGRQSRVHLMRSFGCLRPRCRMGQSRLRRDGIPVDESDSRCWRRWSIRSCYIAPEDLLHSEL